MGVRTQDPVAHHPDEQRNHDEPQQEGGSEDDQLAPDPGLDVKQATNAL